MNTETDAPVKHTIHLGIFRKRVGDREMWVDANGNDVSVESKKAALEDQMAALQAQLNIINSAAPAVLPNPDETEKSNWPTDGNSVVVYKDKLAQCKKLKLSIPDKPTMADLDLALRESANASVI